jgi:hypothetical protein
MAQKMYASAASQPSPFFAFRPRYAALAQGEILVVRKKINK